MYMDLHENSHPVSAVRRTSFETWQCPIARGLERVGDRWCILILRDAFLGTTRFAEFQKSLAIAPNILTHRLGALVAGGLLARQHSTARPSRQEYVLTECGRDFRPVLWALLAWGNRHYAPEGPSVEIADRLSGTVAEPVLVDRASGRPLTAPAFGPVSGPAADDRTRRRYSAPASPPTRPSPGERDVEHRRPRP